MTPEHPVRWWRVLLGALVLALGLAIVVVLDVFATPGSGNTVIGAAFLSALLVGVFGALAVAIAGPSRRVRRVLGVALGWAPGALLLTTAVDMWLNWRHYPVNRHGGHDIVGARILAVVLLVLGAGAAIGYVAAIVERLRKR